MTAAASFSSETHGGQAHGHIQRNIQKPRQATGLHRRKQLPLLLRRHHLRKDGDGTLRHADDGGLLLRPDPVRGDRGTPAAPVPLHGKRQQGESHRPPALRAFARRAEPRDDELRLAGNAHDAPAPVGQRLRADHPKRQRRGRRALPAHAKPHDRRPGRERAPLLRIPDLAGRGAHDDREPGQAFAV